MRLTQPSAFVRVLEQYQRGKETSHQRLRDHQFACLTMMVETLEVVLRIEVPFFSSTFPT